MSNLPALQHAPSINDSPQPDADPLILPTNISKNTFYISPVANPDLVLALCIPGHPLYSGHQLPSSPSEHHLKNGAFGEDGPDEDSKKQEKRSSAFGSTLSHFFGNVSNTVTNTAANTIGIKNQLEFNKPKLKLMTRAIVATGASASPTPANQHLNQKWFVSKEDGCIYSCVEEKDANGSLYRLGLKKNQMIIVKSKESSADACITGKTPETTKGSPDPPSTTQNSMASSSSSHLLDLAVSAPANSNSIAVTTARGNTVLCPLRFEATNKPVKADELKSLISVNSIQVIIEDVESGSGGLNRTSSLSSGSSSKNGSSRDFNKLLIIKNMCCGNLECELEKIDVGSSCGFKNEKDSEVTMNPTTPTHKDGQNDKPAATNVSTGGINLKQVWRIESDFSIWLSTLSRSVSTEYNLTRKLQKIEEQHKKIRDSTPEIPPLVPMKFNTDYEYQLIWSSEGTKASNEVSIWKPKFPAGSNSVYFGDYCHGFIKAPTKKETLVIGGNASGSLHRGVIRPADFELVYTKTKGKQGNLYIWQPIAPPGIDAIGLGHIATAGKKEEKPHVDCGLVMVLREYLKDTGHPLSSPIWTDANIGGGQMGSFWSARHCFTFFVNPGSHHPPTGSYYMLLDPTGDEQPEKCPLLRTVETMNSGWDPIFDDKNTLAKMDISVWRPQVDRTYVRFGDMVVRGHNVPHYPAVVAKDHPAFKRPKGFTLLTKLYRNNKKAYVYQPIPPDSDHIVLGLVVSSNKDDPPLPDCVRCVHKDALIPLGVLKQMWIEHHDGMMNTLTLGVANFMNLSKDYPWNMLWKNRSLNTFMIKQNTHERPDGPVYRLTMTDGELARTVSSLEIHAKWVLESFLLALKNAETVLVESNYKRLAMSSKQAAIIFQAIKGIYKHFEADGASAAFTISPAFAAYLKDFEQNRLRQIYAHFKRYLYENIAADVKDHDSTLELLDDSWSLLQQMDEVHKIYDKIEEWQPPITNIRFPGTQKKSLVSILMDEHIGREIFERFLEVFPPRAPRMMDEEENEEDAELEEEMVVLASCKDGSSKTTQTNASKASTASSPQEPTFKRVASTPDAELIEAQRMETKATLEKLSKFTEELDAVIGITEQMEIRRLYLEYYQSYLTHTIGQEWPVRGSTARSAATNRKLGMASILAIVGWISTYIELVEQDLFEGDRAEARVILCKMDDLVDRFMDAHDEHSKEKILQWISNILRQEEHASVELLDGEDSDAKHLKYYFTSGPSDLFLNINTMFDSQSENLTGRPLARIALMYLHVLTYFQQVQAEYWKQVTAVKDETTHETCLGKTPIPVMKHAGTLQKPYAFLLAQINNSRLYQHNVDELGEKVIHRLESDEAPEELIASLEDAFAQCNEEFQTLGLGVTEVLIRHIASRLSGPFDKVFNEKIWFTDPEYLQSAILDELDELCSFFVPNIEGNIYLTHLLRESARGLVKGYLRSFLNNLKNNLSNTMTIEKVAERIRQDRGLIKDYCLSIKKWNISDAVEKQLKVLDLLADFLTADPDFLKLHVSEVAKVFKDMGPEFTPAIMTSYLISLRKDVSSEDKKNYLQPYTAELKAIEDAKKAAMQASITSTTNKLVHILSNKPNHAIVPAASPTSDSSIGTTPMGLEIVLLKGTDLAIKDSTTSDPYVNIILLNSNGSRLDKVGSKTIEKTLNPVWNETFSKFRPNDVAAMSKIRFECWDKDLFGKDFMGFAELTLKELRDKQLLDRKSAVGKNAPEDYTQEPLMFHLKLLPLEGHSNEGKDKVSGYIDVRIRYYKLSGVTKASPSGATTTGKSSATAPKKGGEDDLDFGLEDQGQTGSKRPPPVMDSAGAGAGSPTIDDDAKQPEGDSNSHPSTPTTTTITIDDSATLVNEDGSRVERTSSTVLQEITTKGPQWKDIIGTLKLARMPSSLALPGVDGAGASSSRSKRVFRTATTLPLASITTKFPSHDKLTLGKDETKTPKKMKKGDQVLDFFGLQ